MVIGSPNGPSLANLFMCALEKSCLDICPSNFKPVVYQCYVDDNFCLLGKGEGVDLFPNYINTFHNNLNFTVEKESSNSLQFLDILLSLQVILGNTFSHVYTLTFLHLVLTNVRLISRAL